MSKHVPGNTAARRRPLFWTFTKFSAAASEVGIEYCWILCTLGSNLASVGEKSPTSTAMLFRQPSDIFPVREPQTDSDRRFADCACVTPTSVPPTVLLAPAPLV